MRFELGATKVFASSNYRALHATHVYAYAIGGRIVGPGGQVPLTTVLMGFSKGRVAVILFGTSASRDPMEMSPLARRMLARFPGSWVIAT